MAPAGTTLASATIAGASLPAGYAWYQATLGASDAAAGDSFGGAVALDGRSALVGAGGHASGGLFAAP